MKMDLFYNPMLLKFADNQQLKVEAKALSVHSADNQHKRIAKEKKENLLHRYRRVT